MIYGQHSHLAAAKPVLPPNFGRKDEDGNVDNVDKHEHYGVGKELDFPVLEKDAQENQRGRVGGNVAQEGAPLELQRLFGADGAHTGNHHESCGGVGHSINY